jgi:hypothetical protein
MSDIPRARQILEHLLDEMATGRSDRMFVRASVQAALRHMVRKKHKAQKANATANPITAEIRDKVLRSHMQDPSISTRALAQKYNINQGRISEIIAGDYDFLVNKK